MDAERGITSVWTRPQRERREQPALSRDQIVAEAVRLLDEEGLEALSMRKLGARLNAGATSLYTHVANKHELLELATNEVFGEPRQPVNTAGWRPAMLDFGRDLRAMVLRHRWLAAVMGTLGTLHMAPNMMLLTESIFEVLESEGFSMDEADTAMNIIYSFVMGMTTVEAGYLTMLRHHGLTEQEWLQQTLPVAKAASAQYRRTSQRYISLQEQQTPPSRDEIFDHQLEMVLNGLDPAMRHRD